MRTAVLTRTETSEEGTFGTLVTDSGFACYSLELPWRDNAPNKSCIPDGVYACQVQDSPKHGRVYYVLNVPGRTDVEIHAANWAGDVEKGRKCQLLGCIAPGNAIGELVGQQAVLGSRDALSRLMADLDEEPFQLTILWRDGVK